MNATLWQKLVYFYKSNSALTRFIIINVAAFFLVNLIGLIVYLSIPTEQAALYSNPFTYWLAVPSSIDKLLSHPWTLFTYMFFHLDFFHILFNMITLYFGGKVFMMFLNSRQFTYTYIFGGLAGAVFYIGAFNLFPVFKGIVNQSIAMGASASVLAILVGIATYKPNTELMLLLIGRVKLKYIALFFIFIDIISIDKGNPGGHIAHLGGAFWGFLYAIGLQRGLFGKTNPYAKKRKPIFQFKRKSKLKVEYNSGKPFTDEEYRVKQKQKQHKIDKILDKISHSGYESLSAEEKEFLFSQSSKK